jgi:hypothetical protein
MHCACVACCVRVAGCSGRQCHVRLVRGRQRRRRGGLEGVDHWPGPSTATAARDGHQRRAKHHPRVRMTHNRWSRAPDLTLPPCEQSCVHQVQLHLWRRVPQWLRRGCTGRAVHTCTARRSVQARIWLSPQLPQRELTTPPTTQAVRLLAAVAAGYATMREVVLCTYTTACAFCVQEGCYLPRQA